MNSASPDPRLNRRVWEIDALRGFLILSVLIDHLTLTVDAFCIDGYYNIDAAEWARITDPLGVWFTTGADGAVCWTQWVTTLRSVCTYPAVDTFFILSGISCVFSRNNFKRALKVLAAGFFIAAFTFILWQATGDATRFIRFGVLMCYASCQLIYTYFFEKRSNKTLLIAAIPVFIIGYFLRYHGLAIHSPLLYPFGVGEYGDLSSDWWPIFPMLGWFLLGAVIGRKFYDDKKTLLPSKAADTLTRPLQFLGRHSGVIYVGHILLYTAAFCGIGYLLGLF